MNQKQAKRLRKAAKEIASQTPYDEKTAYKAMKQVYKEIKFDEETT